MNRKVGHPDGTPLMTSLITYTPGGKEDHYMTTLISRALFGGTEYLDGYSAYKNPKGYYHIVTYGMSELYHV